MFEILQDDIIIKVRFDNVFIIVKSAQKQINSYHILEISSSSDRENSMKC